MAAVRRACIAWWVVVAGCAAAAAWQAPAQLRDARNDLEVGERPRLYRELEPARRVGLDEPEVFVAARREMPPDARFAVRAGDGARDWAGWFARYWLLPRRLTPRVEEAAWLLAYDADPRAAGVPLRRVVRPSPSTAVAELPRR